MESNLNNFLENIECKVCNNRDENKFLVQFRTKGLNIVECQNCEFVFIPPFYRKEVDYRTYKDDAVLQAVIAADDWPKIQRQLLKFKLIKKYKQKGKLFDLGVGWGHFLQAGKQLGYEVFGIELAKLPLKYAIDYLKLPVEEADFLSFTPKTDFYDIITLWDVLEHIDRCDEVVEKCHSMLKSEGYIFLQVPQIDSFIAKRERTNWQAMGLDHVNYFSPKTITKLLTDKGFEVVKIKSSIEIKHYIMYYWFEKKRKKNKVDSPIKHSERQEYYNKTVNKPKWQLKIMLFLHNILYNALSFFGIGDEMIVVAKKK